MKITVSLNTPKNKGANQELSQVCFRVREKSSDLRARTELLANPEFWDETIPGYRPSAKLPKKEIQKFNKQISDITVLIHEQYNENCDGTWLRNLIKGYLHPEEVVEDPCTTKNKWEFVPIEGSFNYYFDKYLEEYPASKGRTQCVKSTFKKIQRFELFQQKVKKNPDYVLRLDDMDANLMQDIHHFIENEYIYMEKYPYFYNLFDFKRNKRPVPMSHNGMVGIFRHIRAVLNWCFKQGFTSNEKWRIYSLNQERYGDPIYLTIEERNQMLNYDFSDFPRLECHRDMFIFQCMIGCRVGDLYKLTMKNVKDGFVEYYPNKCLKAVKKDTYNKVCRIPLNDTAKQLLDKYADSRRDTLFPCNSQVYYNEDIKVIALICGINRKVAVIDPKTGQSAIRPIYTEISSHTARKTFIANLYLKVKDPNLIASMSGHSENSKAFRRYRKIAEEMKQELVEKIN